MHFLTVVFVVVLVAAVVALGGVAFLLHWSNPLSGD